MYPRPRTSQLRRVKRINTLVAVGIIVLIVSTIGVARGIMRNDVFILGAFVLGAVATVTAWFSNIRWKEGLWTVGVILVAFSIASWVLIAQFWLAAGAFALFVAVIVGPTVRRQVRDETHNRRR